MFSEKAESENIGLQMAAEDKVLYGHQFNYEEYFDANVKKKLEIILSAVEHVLSLEDGKNRITSYNVCYTKLLRLVSFGFFMFIMYVLTLKTHNIFINPILAVIGYNIYDVKFDKNGRELQAYFLIKGDRLKKTETCRIVELSEHLYLVTERNPSL